MENKKYQGIIPAFYACYDQEGAVSVEKTAEMAEYLIGKGIQGLYVCGSSGECIYQTVAERKQILETVMKVAQGKDICVIAHVACNSTADSCILAAHAESLGVDAIASIPPIYFKLPPVAIAKYWNDISAAAPNTDFIIYNIPQLAGVSLTVDLLREMKKNPRVIGVKNSSMPVQDIQMWHDEDVMVFNGPDEQLVSGIVAGACGGIGGTYGVMPELFLTIMTTINQGDWRKAREIQNEICHIISILCSGTGNMYAMAKEVIRLQDGPDIGSVRSPLLPLTDADKAIAVRCHEAIAVALNQYC